MMYRCLQCGKDIEYEQIKDKIRCGHCGYRILMKVTPKLPVKFKAK